MFRMPINPPTSANVPVNLSDDKDADALACTVDPAHELPGGRVRENDPQVLAPTTVPAVIPLIASELTVATAVLEEYGPVPGDVVVPGRIASRSLFDPRHGSEFGPVGNTEIPPADTRSATDPRP